MAQGGLNMGITANKRLPQIFDSVEELLARKRPVAGSPFFFWFKDSTDQKKLILPITHFPGSSRPARARRLDQARRINVAIREFEAASQRVINLELVVGGTVDPPTVVPRAIGKAARRMNRKRNGSIFNEGSRR
jgi:hypothetical protein